jgi:hypothetical protein
LELSLVLQLLELSGQLALLKLLLLWQQFELLSATHRSLAAAQSDSQLMPTFNQKK